MKTILYFLIGSVLCFSFPSLLNAQEVDNPKQVFIDNDWYLTKLVINEKEHPFVPDQSQQNVYLDIDLFEPPNSGQIWSEFCEIGDALFELQGNEDLYTWYWGFMASMSDPSDNCYDGPPIDDEKATTYMYFDVFWMYGGEPHHHQYIINQVGTAKELILTADNGNQAYFQNIPLSVQDFEKDNLVLYPNPVKDHLYIENITENVQLEIYDLSGRKLLHQEINNSSESVNVSQLSDGIYLYQLNQNGQRVKTGKLVKEVTGN